MTECNCIRLTELLQEALADYEVEKRRGDNLQTEKWNAIKALNKANGREAWLKRQP